MLRVYDELDEVPDDELPGNIHQMPTAAMGEEYVIRLDI